MKLFKKLFIWENALLLLVLLLSMTFLLMGCTSIPVTIVHPIEITINH